MFTARPGIHETLDGETGSREVSAEAALAWSLHGRPDYRVDAIAAWRPMALLLSEDGVEGLAITSPGEVYLRTADALGALCALFARDTGQGFSRRIGALQCLTPDGRLLQALFGPAAGPEGVALTVTGPAIWPGRFY